MRVTRQFLLGRQRDRRRRPGLALPLDVMASHRQMRVGVAVDRGLQGRTAEARCRLGTRIDRSDLMASDADLGPGARIGSHAQRRLRARRNVRCQRCIHLCRLDRSVAQADSGAYIGRQRRHGHLLRRGVRCQLHLHGGRQYVTHHRQRCGVQLQAQASVRTDRGAALRLSRGGSQGHFRVDLDRHRLRILRRKRLQVAQRLIGFRCPCVAAGQRAQQCQDQRGGHQQEGARIACGAAAAVAGGQFRGHNQSIELAVPYTPVDAVHEHFPRRRTTGMSVDLPLGR